MVNRASPRMDRRNNRLGVLFGTGTKPLFWALRRFWGTGSEEVTRDRGPAYLLGVFFFLHWDFACEWGGRETWRWAVDCDLSSLNKSGVGCYQISWILTLRHSFCSLVCLPIYVYEIVFFSFVFLLTHSIWVFVRCSTEHSARNLRRGYPDLDAWNKPSFCSSLLLSFFGAVRVAEKGSLRRTAFGSHRTWEKSTVYDKGDFENADAEMRMGITKVGGCDARIGGCLLLQQCNGSTAYRRWRNQACPVKFSMFSFFCLSALILVDCDMKTMDIVCLVRFSETPLWFPRYRFIPSFTCTLFILNSVEGWHDI